MPFHSNFTFKILDKLTKSSRTLFNEIPSGVGLGLKALGILINYGPLQNPQFSILAMKIGRHTKREIAH